MIDALVEEKFQRVWDRFRAQEQALGKADEALSAYKTIANEFRGTLSDQAATFVSRQEFNSKKDALSDKIDVLQSQVQTALSTNQGRSSGFSSIGFIVVSCIGALVALTTTASLIINLLKTNVIN